MPAPTLKYFTSVSLPGDISYHSTFTQFEDLLQQEHESNGQHPRASTSGDGFMTQTHAEKLEAMWDWFQKQQNKA